MSILHKLMIKRNYKIIHQNLTQSISKSCEFLSWQFSLKPLTFVPATTLSKMTALYREGAQTGASSFLSSMSTVTCQQ